MRSKFFRFLPIVSFVVPFLFCGCETVPSNLFTVSGPAWHVQQGQALWTPRAGAPQFGGDLVVATNGLGDSLVQFAKTPISLVAAQTTPQYWTLNFYQLGGFWKGHQPAPKKTIWPYLTDALEGKPLPEPLHFEQQSNGNWLMENEKTGERLEGFLSP